MYTCMRLHIKTVLSKFEKSIQNTYCLLTVDLPGVDKVGKHLLSLKITNTKYAVMSFVITEA